MTDNRSSRNIPISSLVTNGEIGDDQKNTIKGPQLSNSPHLSTILNPASELTPKTKVMSLSELMNEEEDVSILNEDASEEDQGEVTKEVPKEPIPAIINIEIPLSTHNDIHSEFIFSKLVEEKYGADAQPTTINKSLWNYDADEDDDDEDGDDDAILEPETNDQQTIYDDEDEIVKSLKIKFAPGLSDIEKEKIVLNEIHKRKMENNKRIGKYDVFDPFIDDEELVYEEDFNSNADGWYVWYGELEINNKRAKNPEVIESTKPQKQVRQGRTSNNSSNSSSAQSRGKVLLPPSSQGQELSNGDKRRDDPPTATLTPAKKRKVEESKVSNDGNDGNDGKGKDKESSGTEKHPALIIGSFGF